MPTLNWIGKHAVVTHHRQVPLRLLEPVPELCCGDGAGKDAGNLIVQGDNLHALKALLPRYAGQVKCICIDPPYNTGNEGWVYNDNVNSPEIRRWLGEVVGKEGETLDRHDRWLCMMYPRLVLLKQLLRDAGVNLGRREGSSFFLQKADGRFYPDFVCRLPGSAGQSGPILAVEYKGADRWAGAEDDRLIGGLWANLSEGRCRFVIVKDKRWDWIEEKLSPLPVR